MADMSMPDLTAHPKKATPHPSCRLYALLAREAPVGVIFRRGPSKWVQVVHWDTSTDTFTPGQWFHGRIYERRGDLSPDGKFLIYFAQKINPQTVGSDYTYAWTAVSRPPYLTALALWPNGCCWGGGGLFLSGRKVRLNHREGGDKPHPDHRPQGLTVTNDGGGSGEDDPILSRRLERDGWHLTQAWRGGERGSRGYVTEQPDLRRRQNPHGWQKLIMETSIQGFRSVHRYSVRYAEGTDLALDGAEWADWDQSGRLVYARAGKLFGLSGDAIGQEPPQELADLNDNKPEAVKAPEWATVW